MRKSTVFLAADVRANGVLRREVTEDIEIGLIPLAELRALTMRGEMRDAPSALAILLAYEALESGGTALASWARAPRG